MPKRKIPEPIVEEQVVTQEVEEAPVIEEKKEVKKPVETEKPKKVEPKVEKKEESTEPRKDEKLKTQYQKLSGPSALFFFTQI